MPYWISEKKWIGPGLLLIVVALALGLVYLNLLLNGPNHDFYNALDGRNFFQFTDQPALCNIPAWR